MYMRKMAVGPVARGRIDLATAGRRQRPRDRRGVRPQHERHHRDRPRPPAAPRPDRGDPRCRRAHQAHPGRGRDRVDHGGDPGHERPPGDRDRRLAAGASLRRCASLPGRRAPGSALADHARRDRGGSRARDRGREQGLRDRGAGARRGDRRCDGRDERRPPARRPLPGGQRTHALRSSCAPATTGCGSSTASTSSPASGAKRCACSARRAPESALLGSRARPPRASGCRVVGRRFSRECGRCVAR